MSESETGTLKDAAYQLCKSVVAAPQREEVRATIQTLTRAPADPKSPMSVGHTARQQHAQFYGYLVVDDYRETALPFTLSPLLDDERRVLSRGQAAVMSLNDACIASILQAAPNCASAVHPYAHLKPLRTPVVAAPTLFSEDALRAVVSAFSETRAVRAIVETHVDIRAKLAPDQCLGMVERLVNDVETAGALSAPKDLSDMCRKLSPNSGEAALAQYWFGMSSVRGMLQALDQMVYQATLQDRIQRLNEDTVFGVRGPSRHAVATGYSVDCQPDGGQITIGPGDVLLLALDTHEKTRALCLVNHVTINFDQELGYRMKVDMRELDADLNPYSGLMTTLR